MMKRSGWIIWVLTAWMAKADAQQAISSYLVTGIIRDSATTRVVAYATVSLLDTAKNNIASTYSLETGAFKSVLSKPGTYQVDISFVGYKTRELTIMISQPVTDLGALLLSPGNDYLQEVSITSVKRLVDQKPGMLVYNAENDITNKGGTAADVLRKAPVLSVDAQGNVSLRGNSNLKILVNGKYSGQMARSAADALNMMPANMIKSVEIITTPSAKYDAEGAAGVINIITKKGKGALGSTLEAGVSNMEQMLNPRLSFSDEKWNINLTGHLHRLRRKSAAIIGRTSLSGTAETSRLLQVIEKDNTAPHTSADLAVDYTINEVSELSLGINWWLGKWPEDSRTHTVVSDPGGNITEEYLQEIASSSSYLGADINLGYNRQFRRPGQQLALQVQSSPSRDLSKYDAVQTSMNRDLLYRELNNSKAKNREWTFQADYVQPLNAKGTFHLETGAKLILRKVGNPYDVSASDPVDVNKLIPQDERSDHFKYSQDVLAGYSMLRLNLKNNWYIEAGARFEATYMKGAFMRSATAFDNRFMNFVPTATLSKRIDSYNTVTISYTKRLTRPYIWDLNPNADASDPKNIQSGNPHLQPEMAHQAELTYGLNAGKAFFLNTAVFWKQTDNAIVEFMETNSEGVSFTSKQNLAANRQFGFNLSATSQLSGRWTANGNININYFDYNSEALDIFRSGWGANININSTYQLPHYFSVQVFGEYNTRQVTLLGKLGNIYHYSFAGKKEIKKARMTLTLSAVNLFAKYATQTDHKQRPTFISSVDDRYYNRAVKLTVSWEFGGMQKRQSERKRIENNDINVQGKG
jgi:outer membrane receptor protein involved in Fe transport